MNIPDPKFQEGQKVVSSTEVAPRFPGQTVLTICGAFYRLENSHDKAGFWYECEYWAYGAPKHVNCTEDSLSLWEEKKD